MIIIISLKGERVRKRGRQTNKLDKKKKKKKKEEEKKTREMK